MGVVESRFVEVLGSSMHYRETGVGRPVLLLHGNPTSSLLWRHVLAAAAAADDGHRYIAVDLIGMGSSAKPVIGYRFGEHATYLDAFTEVLGLRDLVLVGHDWGVALALDHLCRHPDQVRAVAFMEGHVRPLESWDEFDPGGRELFRRLRTAGEGERMVLHENFLLEVLLPTALRLPVAADVLAGYRANYGDRASRRPLLQWAREIPVAGEPADVAERMAAAAEHLRRSSVPALLVHGQPGVLMTPSVVDWCRRNVCPLTVVDVAGPAGHFLPEDRPKAVTDAITDWIAALP